MASARTTSGPTADQQLSAAGARPGPDEASRARGPAPGSTAAASTGPRAGAGEGRLVEALREALDGRWRHVREQARRELPVPDLLPDPGLGIEQYRDWVREQMQHLAGTGYPSQCFSSEHGGTGDVGASVTSFDLLANADLSLLVKAGVQWGLFGGAVENLGTQRHHALVPEIISLALPGCYAMTETGHGSDVQSIGTTATYDPQSHEFVLTTPDRASYKDYIGGAARDAKVAAVFAQLATRGEQHGVHCFLVPIRDEDGALLAGVHAEDNGPKAGLNGVDNGRLAFDEVRVPREALLNRYGDVAPDGAYTSPIASANARFFTMLGTLIRGRISVGGAAGSAARLALAIATTYAEQRRQFQAPGGEEVVVMDYLLHQRRLLPLIASSYALTFAQNELVSRMHDLQTAEDPDPTEQRELESRAAGLKAITTWHATRTIQESREACGGAGYLAENRLPALKADTDVFTTFEGDNHVLLQLVAKELLVGYASEFSGLDGLGMVRFASRQLARTVIERTTARELIARLVESTRSRGAEDADLLSRATHLTMFEDREQHLLDTLARRLRRARGADADSFTVFNAAQDHVLEVGRAHVDRVVLEAFVAGIDACADADAKQVLGSVCDLYVLHRIEADKAWFLEHGRLTPARSKAVTERINALCRQLRPLALDLVGGFGIPDSWLGAAMLADPGVAARG